MITILHHRDDEMAEVIFKVFQASYAVEAAILNLQSFPPLSRTQDYFLSRSTEFYGFYSGKIIAGIIEIECHAHYTDIHSLVVHPSFFKQGIASKLLTFVEGKKLGDVFLVETAIDNIPAVRLYQKFNYIEIAQWNTDFGIRKVRFRKEKNIIA